MMPRPAYNQKLTNDDILELFESGKYWVDVNTGTVYSEHTLAEVYSYEGNAEGHLFTRLYSQPKHRSLPVTHVVWMFGTKTALPKGWEIHHRDEDVHNNCFDNLIALHPVDHRKIHKEEDIPF